MCYTTDYYRLLMLVALSIGADMFAALLQIPEPHRWSGLLVQPRSP